MRIQIAFVVAIALLMTACGADSHESLGKEGVDHMEKMIEILEGVSDADSAKAAESDMKELMEDMKDLEARMKKLGEPTPDQKKAIAEQLAGRTKDLQQRMMSAMMKIMQYPELQKAMKDAQGTMK